jgi:hypothetical protein
VVRESKHIVMSNGQRIMRSAIVASILAVSASGCANREVFDLTGTWQGSESTDRNASVVMMLRQDDRDVTGVVCRVSSGRRVFYDVPVSGRYPRVAFEYFGATVNGRASGNDLIVVYRRDPVFEELHFSRASSAEYERCRNAP